MNIRGIKHYFPFINIRTVPREVLKTEAEARGIQPSRGTLRFQHFPRDRANVNEWKIMNDKIRFDRYYCINSAKHCQNEENTGAPYFITSSHFPTRVRFKKNIHDLGPVQVLIILHVLCVAPGSKHN